MLIEAGAVGGSLLLGVLLEKLRKDRHGKKVLKQRPLDVKKFTVGEMAKAELRISELELELRAIGF